MAGLRVGFCLWLGALLALGATLPAAHSQPKQPPPAPKWPAIDPTKARLEQTFRGLAGPGLAVAASDTAMMLAAACDRQAIQLWCKDTLLGLRDGSNSCNALGGHKGSVLALAWGNGPLVSAGADKKILVWNVGEAKIAHALDSAFMPRAIALSPGGKTLAVAGDQAGIQLWDVEQGKPGGELKGHNDWLQCVHFSEDGQQLLSGGYEGHALLWNVADGKAIRELPGPPKEKPKTPPPIDPVTAVAFSPEGKQALIGYASGNIDQVNLPDGQKIRSLTGHGSAVTGVLFHPSGTLAASSSKDGSVRLWNPANGTLIKALTDHTAWVEGITLFNQGTRLISVGADQTVRVWNLQG